MYQQHPCKGCGKLLNQDGGHPAELYAGTYTGLCYDCERKEAYVIHEFYDGCKLVSHPPSCPGHSRNRQGYCWYPECKQCTMGVVWESHPDIAGMGGGYGRSSCPSCSHRQRLWLVNRRERKLHGLTPYEELATRFQEASQTHAQEAKQRTTKTRTKERKTFLTAVESDYTYLAHLVLTSVLQDSEERLLDSLDDQIRRMEQYVAADPQCVPFASEQLALLQNAVNDLRQALPAQQAVKKRQTRVLI